MSCLREKERENEGRKVDMCLARQVDGWMVKIPRQPGQSLPRGEISEEKEFNYWHQKQTFL
jgi:hypothetical protein